MCVQEMDTGAGPVQLPPGEQVVTQHVVLPLRVQQLLQEHTVFLHQQGDTPAMFACSTPSRQFPEPVTLNPALMHCLLETTCYLCILDQSINQPSINQSIDRSINQSINTTYSPGWGARCDSSDTLA